MSSHNRRLLLVRRFLNLPGHHGGAYILAEVEREESTRPDTITKQPRHEVQVWASVEIHDCTRQISLSLDADSRAGRRNTLRKLTILIEVLTRLREVLEGEFADLDRRGHGRRRPPTRFL
jgi:hypothetical protein